MRVLMTNQHLAERAGSELATLELAEVLAELGHAVAVFTPYRGHLAGEWSRRTGRPVFTVSDAQLVRAWAPTVLHIHHWPTYLVLRRMGVGAPAVFGFLGVLPPEENPPPTDLGSVPGWWALSPEVRDNVRRIPGWAGGDGVVLGNWFDDRGLVRPTVRAAGAVHRAVVVSHHFPAELLERLRRLAAQRSVVVDHVGRPENPRRVDAQLLLQYDAVVTLGRTALLATALGLPTLVLDQAGGDGWIRPRNVAELSACNFSGRARGVIPDDAQLALWLAEIPERKELLQVQDWAWSDGRLTQRGAQIEALLAEASAGRGVGHSAEVRFGRWSDWVADDVQTLSRQIGETEALRSAVEALRADRDRVVAAKDRINEQLDRVVKDRDVLGAEVTALLADRDRVLADRDRVLADRDRIAGLLGGVLGSRTWRAAAPLQRMAHSARAAVEQQYAEGGLLAHTVLSAAHFASEEARARLWTPKARRAAAVGSSARLELRVSEAIPPLAWLSIRSHDGWIHTVGRDVEVRQEGFFEGVWDGDFASFAPHRHEFSLGSGVIGGSSPRFVMNAYPKEFGYVLTRESDASVFVSNSLAFVLQAAEVAPGSASFSALLAGLHDHTYSEGQRGIDRGRSLVARTSGLALHRCRYYDFTLGPEGSPRRLWSRPRRFFRTFAEYEDFMVGTLRRIFDNGRSPDRRQSLKPVVALSGGYDSSASAALAVRAGCHEAVSLDVEVYGRDDSGRRVAESLGMSVREFQHLMGAQVADLNVPFEGALQRAALEFIATAGLGDDVTYLPFEAVLAHRILLTGTGGDLTWERVAKVSSGFPMRSQFEMSMTEFRLRVGFARVPVPYLGTRFMPPLRDLSASPGLRPWSVGGDYDRPVARRLAEEAGVPRGAFAREKAATAPLITNRAEMFPDAMATVMERYRGWRE